MSDVNAGNEAWHLAAETTFKVLPSRKEKMYFIFCCTNQRVKVHCESSGEDQLEALRPEVAALSKRLETVEALVLDKEKVGKKRRRGDSR